MDPPLCYGPFCCKKEMYFSQDVLSFANWLKAVGVFAGNKNIPVQFTLTDVWTSCRRKSESLWINK